MPRQAGISAKISGDAKPLKAALDSSLQDTQTWVNKIVGINAQAQKSYNSLAFSGPVARGKSPIQLLAEEDARAWARRMSDTDRAGRAWGNNVKRSSGDALLQIAQFADDAQYGLRGVMNNIPSLVMALGGSAGLAGAASIAAVAGYALGEKLRDLFSTSTRTEEQTRQLEQATREWADTLRDREQSAVNGTIEGRERLAAVTAAISREYEYLNANLERNAAVERAVADATLRRDQSRIAGDDPESVGKRGAMEISAEVARADAELSVIQKRRDVNTARMRAAAKEAEAAEQIARDAWTAYEVDKGTALISEETKAMNKVRAMRADADAKAAREAADRIADEVMFVEIDLIRRKEEISKTSALKLEQMARDLQNRLAKMANDNAQKQIEADKKKEEAAKAADKKLKTEEASAEIQRKRTLEAEREAILQIKINRAKAEGNQEEVRRLEKERAFQNNRDRLIDAGMDPARASRAARQIVDSEDEAGSGRGRRRRRSFGVDDVHRYQRGSLRGDLDAYIGPIGNGGRWDSGAERRAHTHQTRSVQAAAEDRQLAEIAKSLKAIEQNTEGLQKTKSEPLRRS